MILQSFPIYYDILIMNLAGQEINLETNSFAVLCSLTSINHLTIINNVMDMC